MHLHSVHRSSYYSAPAAHYSTLARRDSGGGGDNLWQMIVAPIAIVVGIILLLCVIARFIKKSYANKKKQSSGQLSHLQLGSLRRKKQADSSNMQVEFSESLFSKGHSDVELGMPTPTHAREWNRPGYSESSSTYRATPYNGFPGGWPAMHGQVPSAYPSPASDGWESVTSHSSKSYR